MSGEFTGANKDIGLGYQIEQRFEQIDIMEIGRYLIQEHRMDPIHAADGVEVLLNTKDTRARGKNKGLDKFFRDVLVPSVIKNPLTIVAATGRSGLGKGRFLMGVGRNIDANMYLSQELGDKRPRIVSSPYVTAWRTAQVHPELGIMKANVVVGTIDRQSSINISRFELKSLVKHVIEPQQQETDEHILLLVEASTPTALPKNKEVPVGITDESPNDRGVSVIFNLARDPRTRDNTYIFAMDREEDVQEKNMRDRNSLPASYAKPGRAYSEHEQAWVLNSQGELVDESLLSPGEKREYEDRKGLSRAPGYSIPRINTEMDKFEEKVLGRRPDNDRPFYRLMQEKLELPDSRFYIVRNSYFDQITTADDRYFTSWNLFYNLYPDIFGHLK